jgi:hypothetical protein
MELLPDPSFLPVAQPAPASHVSMDHDQPTRP